MKNKKYFKDSVGRIVINVDGLIDFVNDKKSIDGFIAVECDDTIKYNKFSENSQLTLYTEELAIQTIEEYDEEAVKSWNTPEIYKNIDLEEWLLNKCCNDVEKARILKELNMYEERNLFPLLKHLIYLIDHFRKNNIVWGVGRGSSVASYVLYKIGVHKVNSIKYNLDITEFLR